MLAVWLLGTNFLPKLDMYKPVKKKKLATIITGKEVSVGDHVESWLCDKDFHSHSLGSIEFIWKRGLFRKRKRYSEGCVTGILSSAAGFSVTVFLVGSAVMVTLMGTP